MLAFIVLRTTDGRGRAIDLAKPGAKIPAGVPGVFEVLRKGGGTIRVSLDGVALDTPAKWPADKPAGVHSIQVDLIRDDAIADARTVTLEVVSNDP